MTKIFITGALGALGSNLILELVKNHSSYKIIATDRFESKNPFLMTELKKFDKEVNRYFQYFPLDIIQFDVLFKLLVKTQPDFIIHLAADLNVNRSFDLIEKSLEVNFFPLISILKYANTYDISRLLLTGTCEEYGFNKVPYNENQHAQPVSPYSWAKTLMAVTSEFVNLVYEIPTVFLRPFTFFGPFQKGNMFIPSLFRAILQNKKEFAMSSGEQVREFNYAPDIAKAYIKALKSPDIDGETLNIGRGVGFKLTDVADLVIKVSESTILLQKGVLPYRNQELFSIVTNTNKAEQLLDWRATTSVEKGLKKTYKWYIEHPNFL